MNPASLSADPEPIPTPDAALPETPDMLVRVYEGEQFRMLGQVRTLDKGGIGLFVYKNFR